MNHWNENDGTEPPRPQTAEPPDEGPEATPEDRETGADAAVPAVAPWLADAPGILPQGTEEAAAAPTATRGGHGALVAAFGLLMLATIGVGIVAMKLWSDRSNAQTALRAAVSVVGATAPGGVADAQERLRAVGAAVDRGQFTEVADQLRRLAKAAPVTPSPEGSAPSALPGGIPGLPGLGAPPKESGPAAEAGNGQKTDDEIARKTGLPPEAVAFFRAHQELSQVFGQANQAALALKRSGGDVTRLRALRNDIISAARLSDEARVKQLLDEFGREFAAQGRKLAAKRSGGRPGGPGVARAGRAGGPPAPLMRLVGQVSQVMQKAQAEGKDISAAIESMRRAELAGRAGNFKLADKLTRQALRQTETARRVPAQPELFRNPIVSMCLNLMRVEDRELSGTLQAVRQTLTEAGAASVKRLRETLKAAASTIEGLGKRRTSFGRTLQRIGTGREAPPPAQSAAEVEVASRKRLEAVRELVTAAVTKAQGMGAAEFTSTGRDQLVASILQAVYGPPAPRAAVPAPAPAAAAETPSDVRQRVQAKLLAAARPYLDVAAQPDKQVQAKLLATTFTEARRLLASGDLAGAEKRVDEGLKALGMDPATAGVDGAPVGAGGSRDAPAPAAEPGPAEPAAAAAP